MAVIDQTLPLRIYGQRTLVRVQEKARAEDGSVRVLLKGAPAALRRLDGYTFATPAGETLTLGGLQPIHPPDGGDAWLALAEARPALPNVASP